ncbi:MAG: hypothetical protein ACI4DU_01415 [Lachnospiraceae bacterium]
MSLDELLMYAQRTNPDMTKEKLIKELNKSRYSAVSLVMVCKNSCKKFSS